MKPIATCIQAQRETPCSKKGQNCNIQSDQEMSKKWNKKGKKRISRYLRKWKKWPHSFAKPEEKYVLSGQSGISLKARSWPNYFQANPRQGSVIHEQSSVNGKPSCKFIHPMFLHLSTKQNNDRMLIRVTGKEPKNHYRSLSLFIRSTLLLCWLLSSLRETLIKHVSQAP